jgi:hypothetical protein
MQGNQGLQFGILSEGVAGQGVGTLSVERTNFVNNVGFEDPDVSTVVMTSRGDDTPTQFY